MLLLPFPSECLVVVNIFWRGKYTEPLSVTYSHNKFYLPEICGRIWLWWLIDADTAGTQQSCTASAHCIPSFIVSLKSWKGQRIPAFACDTKLQQWNRTATCWLHSYRAASVSEIQWAGVSENKTAFLAIKPVMKLAGLGGGNCCCYWTFLFWAKDPWWEISGRKQGSMCVFTFHMSDLWQCPLFAALCDDLMRVQTDIRFRSWGSCSHQVQFSLFFFIYPLKETTSPIHTCEFSMNFIDGH